MSVTLWWGRSKKKGMGGTWVVGKKKGKKKEKRKRSQTIILSEIIRVTSRVERE